MGYAFANPLPEMVTDAGSIYFQNDGLIDMAAVTTLGVSVKEGSGPIGYFGTGLKFAIATILRNGGHVTVYRGLEPYAFATEPDTVRGEVFDFVTMNGQRLGFTTSLGRDWLPWMAFRELASNCRDEGGIYSTSRDYLLADGKTTIVIGGDAMLDVWPDRHSIMLESEPLFANEYIEVHPGHGEYVYYRGVRIHNPARTTSLRYNLRKSIDLTEDRTAKYAFEVEYAIAQGIAAMDDRHLLRRALNCGPDYLEHHLNIATWHASDAFCEVSHSLAMSAESNPNANPSAVSKARELVLDRLEPGQGMALQPVHQMMLDRASAMLRSGGFDIEAFPVICVETLGPQICGMAKDGKIFLSALPFQKGTREVAATLLEEYAHLRSGQSDCTRGFQNWLFDQLLVQAERAAAEPF